MTELGLIAPPTVWWIVAIGLMGLGVLGTVLPVLPGTILVLAGIVIGAWIDGFVRVSGWTVGVITVLALLAWVADYVAAVLGARKAGASPLALAGAALGTVLGIFTGLVGLLFMPLAGAMAGEYWARRDAQRATRVGLATWIGLLVATVVKVVLAFLMIGLFFAAWLWW
ncbi:DUF456 domain-containing protein [Caldimonas thermodepolymerans]|jgi:uncharacterized protein YqgC (DUF456 family)|uniref:DUF456 domain-containing protein n=1 Tax=Caldimonas thermodepolymerans TaxID=215580 RepID=A0A2S5T448_9BURK|nr:DUF456 domain-containing protein [Caldimonas thermodepolymerans]PPE69709.1 DUF456 domain-containing protein [Caldimonas thermodepolymerans]QPC31879.1 DUF456 domain-containing protein [Caldimonas thermodepolymerans]RDI01607.1 hypothetical protein DES46_103170 [Caldimonas thermodepolymerans]TCP04945.1 hypothetical protein EV676_10931 [Caldimonas thermodepolymerans]UZG44666.1 DUF456 domain-containing protein [Caldimonas thermodepolymerans]